MGCPYFPCVGVLALFLFVSLWAAFPVSYGWAARWDRQVPRPGVRWIPIWIAAAWPFWAWVIVALTPDGAQWCLPVFVVLVPSFYLAIAVWRATHNWTATDGVVAAGPVSLLAAMGAGWALSEFGALIGSSAVEMLVPTLVIGAVWPIAACWGVLVWGIRIRRHELAARGNRCPACGYDLSGSRGGVCPECGRS